MSMITFFKKKTDQTDRGFRDDYTETDEFPLPGWARSSLYALTTFFVIIVVWACISHIDKIVRARGKLVTTGQEIVIRPLVDSIVKDIYVRVGQVVKKDQKIITLDPTFIKSDMGQIKVRIENAKAIIYRARCGLNNEKFELAKEDPYGVNFVQYNIFKQQTSEYAAKIQSFDSQISSAAEASRSAAVELSELNKQIEISAQILKMRQEVYTAGYDTKLNLLQAESDFSKNKNQAESLQSAITEKKLEIQKLQSEKEAFINNWRKDLCSQIAQANSELEINMQQLAKVERYSQLVDMIVPQDSVVLEIGNISVGSVAKTGESLVKLVPLNDPIEVEARISPQDIGFIRHGDLCKVKIDAFPFQKHGDLKGSLKSIGEDTLIDSADSKEGPYYPSRIALESTNLRNVPEDTRLIPGMSLSAEIVVGKRTIITYVLYPMMKVFNESIREP
jgi:hemolysin D